MTEASALLAQKDALAPSAPDARPPRTLGRRIDDPHGKWLVCVAGIHGNEPAGVTAVECVFAALAASGERLTGAFVAFAGNRAALAAGQRYLDRDLNRSWSLERFGRLGRGERRAREDDELAELSRELSETLAHAEDRVYLLDLHTTSGEGPPFAVLDDALPNRRVAVGFPVPLVLGFEEELVGTMVFHFTARGVTCVAFEGGQHDDRRSIDRCEAAIWIALAKAGILPAALAPRAEAARLLLASSLERAPHLVEVVYRHRIVAGDGFRMLPGFASFDRVSAGQQLAVDANGPVLAPREARLLMPLYQPLGDDGFFLAVPVPRFWFELSAVLRWLRADRLLYLLPGVRAYGDRPDTFLVSRRVARFLVRELFHLLGYRRLDTGPNHYLFTRRRDEV